MACKKSNTELFRASIGMVKAAADRPMAGRLADRLGRAADALNPLGGGARPAREPTQPGGLLGMARDGMRRVSDGVDSVRSSPPMERLRAHLAPETAAVPEKGFNWGKALGIGAGALVAGLVARNWMERRRREQERKDRMDNMTKLSAALAVAVSDSGTTKQAWLGAALRPVGHLLGRGMAKAAPRTMANLGARRALGTGLRGTPWLKPIGSKGIPSLGRALRADRVVPKALTYGGLYGAGRWQQGMKDKRMVNDAIDSASMNVYNTMASMPFTQRLGLAFQTLFKNEDLGRMLGGMAQQYKV